jgi:hypothetical protein
VSTHDEVLVEEVSGPAPVSADAADDGCQVNDDLWPAIRQQAVNLGILGKIVITPARSQDVAATLVSQLGEQVLAQETAPAGDQDPLFLKLHPNILSCTISPGCPGNGIDYRLHPDNLGKPGKQRSGDIK